MVSKLSGMHLKLEGLRKSFGNKAVLRGIDMQVMPGEFVAIVGCSGCGKSTMLRLIAGLEVASAGSVFLDGKQSSELNPTVRMMF